MIDLGESCRRTTEVLNNVTDDQLDAATPCADMSLRELVAHVGSLAEARTAYPAGLAALAQAWRQADAWTGMTRVGGIDLPGKVAGSVALAEVVIHGWDVARTTDQPYDIDAATAEACLTHLAQSDASGTEGLFGPAVDVPDDAPVLACIIGMSGRDPRWTGSS